MTSAPHKDEISGVDTTGHEWDGIRELNNPLPKWWIYSFYVCILWSIVYWVLMPAWPILTTDGWTYTKGLLGYSQRAVVTEEIQDAQAKLAPFRDKIAASEFSEIVTNPELMSIAVAGGKAAFGDNCAPCHGSGAQGAVGFPNLNDDDWIWGGSLDEIHTTLQHGIRWDADDDSRFSQMPAFLADEILERGQVEDVATYVLTLNGSAEANEQSARGAVVFAEQCASCHGADGTGNMELGAPNLADHIWLYGGDLPTIVETVSYSRTGVMPAWSTRLSEGTLKELALYVHSLGGGQ
ncbi:MAG: cytochrome c oxidase cbb3-type subunit 3 [Parvibaculaceae bacterium]|jgi:cytochrome c oxidase cbb3-type subunit 3|nr:cytochrome-c oxidase, cbb3-type subunit III [Parvibaculaceae bacterium]